MYIFTGRHAETDRGELLLLTGVKSPYLLRCEEMSPLFMDTESNSPGFVSDEETHSSTTGSEKGGKKRQNGGKRKEKNRDAARKSRKKQTERADELHEELQCLERSNSALEKEIAALRRDLHLYTTALERHQPLCHLRASSFNQLTPMSASSLPAAARVSVALQGHSCPASTPVQTSRSIPQTNVVPSAGPSHQPGLFPSSKPSPHPPISSSSTVLTPQSLLGKRPRLLTPSTPTNAPLTPINTSLVSNLQPCIPLTTTALPNFAQGTSCVTSPGSAKALLPHTDPAVLSCTSQAVPSIPHSGLVNLRVAKQVPNAKGPLVLSGPFSAHLTTQGAENADQLAQGFPMNTPQLHPVNGTLNHSSSPHALLSSSSQDSPQVSPAHVFAIKSSVSQQNTANPAPLLSLLTVPSPLYTPHTTSSHFSGLVPRPSLPGLPFSQALPSQPPLGDLSRELSLSEFLDRNDWLLDNGSFRWD
ncbi:uncharacterized protein ACJ7VT_012618 [Polymixia lowei]